MVSRTVCRRVILAVIAALCLAACGPGSTLPPSQTPTPMPTIPGATAGSVPRFEPADCRFPYKPQQSPQCGYLVVPEDRSRPDGPTVRLYVAIFPSLYPDPEPDPLIYLHGGPGASDLAEVAFWYENIFGGMTAKRDFIIFDQRGVGYSEPSLECPGHAEQYFESLSQDLRMGLEEWNATHVENCLATLSARDIDLAAYNSTASAADVNDLRIALGYQQVNLYGGSYGTRLALTVLRDFAGGTIRSVILDGAYPLQADLYAERAGNAQRMWEALFAACAADSACSAAYPNLQATFFDLIARLDAQPVSVEISNSVTKQKQRIVVNGSRMIEVFYRASYSSDWLPWLPTMIYKMKDGDYSVFAQATEQLLLIAAGVDPGGYYTVQCNDEGVFSSPALVDAATAAVHPLLAAHFNGGTKASLAVCAKLAPQPLPADNRAVVSSVPTLILAGKYDPITPAAWSELAAETLSNAYLFEFDTAHGVMFGVPCARNLAAAFLADPAVRPAAPCLEKLEQLRPVPGE